MREIEVSRFVAVQPFEIEDAVDPERVVEFEGSFDVLDVEATDAETVVTAGGGGLRMVLRFEPSEDGLYYEQAGESGPFDEIRRANPAPSTRCGHAWAGNPKTRGLASPPGPVSVSDCRFPPSRIEWQPGNARANSSERSMPSPTRSSERAKQLRRRPGNP